MGASFGDQVWLPLLIGLADQIVATALCSLTVRLWKHFIKQLTPQTAVQESAHDQPVPDGDAASRANATPDLEMGNGYGPAEAPTAQVTGDAATGALEQPVEVDVPRS